MSFLPKSGIPFLVLGSSEGRKTGKSMKTFSKSCDFRTESFDFPGCDVESQHHKAFCDNRGEGLVEYDCEG